jgi:hypothetical protein
MRTSNPKLHQQLSLASGPLIPGIRKRGSQEDANVRTGPLAERV